MRDKLIHDYFGADTQVIWNTATEDILKLEEDIKNLISDYSNQALNNSAVLQTIEQKEIQNLLQSPPQHESPTFFVTEKVKTSGIFKALE